MRHMSPSGIVAFCKAETPRSQRYRRSVAVFFVGNLGALLLITALIDSYWTAAPLVVLYMVATFLLFQSVRGMTEAATSALDERQVKLRNTAYRNTYWPGVMVAFLGGIFVASVRDWDTAFELGLFVSVWGLLSSLPTLLLAWTLASDFVDEEE